MGISYSTARWVAPLSFVVNLSCQLYGISSSPNMQDVHNAHLSFWSPQPYFIGAFFFPQQLLQVAWMYRLWKLDPSKSAVGKKEVQVIVNYVPYFAIGNFCIATWMIFWNNEALKTSQLLVSINTFLNLYYIFFRLGPMNTSFTSSVLTHVISKMMAGIGVLDLLHNGSIAFFDHQTQDPSTVIKVATGIGFGVLASMSDWIFGSCLVYDLVALAVGQRIYTGTGWSNLLGLYAVGTASIVGARNWLRPPYVKHNTDLDGYVPASSGDVVV